MSKPKPEYPLVEKNAISFSEARGRKKHYGSLSRAYSRISELRYIKAVQNAILENAAWHEHNYESFMKKHKADSSSNLDERELQIVKKCFEKRNKIAKEMMTDLENYFKEVKK